MKRLRYYSRVVAFVMEYLLPLVMLVLLFAGCTGPAAIDERPVGSVDSPPESKTKSDSQEAPVANDAAEAPEWVVGDWWTFRIGSTYAPARDITIVVVGVDDTSYAVAASEERTALESIWWHLPPIGIVSRADLSWEAHDEPMSILRFPLADGARWTGSIEGQEIGFAARKLPSGAFEVTGLYDEEWLAIRYVYDPAVAQFSNATLNYGSDTHSWSTLELVESGQGFALASFLPMYDDAFLGGFGDPTEADPQVTREFEVPDEVSHVMLGCMAQGIVGEFRVQVTPSEGPAFSCGRTFTSTDPGTHMEIITAPGSPGTWRIVPTVVGPGSVFVEAAAVWLFSCEPTTGEGLLLKPHGNCQMG